MKLRSLVLSALIGFSLAACNSGSAVPTTTPTTQTQTFSNLPTTGGTSVSLPAVSGFSAPTVTLPGLSVSTPISETSSTSVPTGLVTFSVGKVPQSHIAKQSLTVANATALLYIGITPQATVTATGTASFSFPFTTAPSSSNSYYLAFYDGTTWQTAYNTAGTLSGSTVSFTNIALPTSGITLTGGTTYGLVLYAVPNSSATPTPSPSTSPTSSPSPSSSSTSSPTSGTVSVSAGKAASISNIVLASGNTISATLPVSSTSGTLSYAVTTSLPTNYTAPSGITSGANPIAVIAVTPSAAMTFTGGSFAQVMETPSNGVVGTYGLAYLGQGLSLLGGSQTTSGATATITYNLPANFTLSPTAPTYFAIYPTGSTQTSGTFTFNSSTYTTTSNLAVAGGYVDVTLPAASTTSSVGYAVTTSLPNGQTGPATGTLVGVVAVTPSTTLSLTAGSNIVVDFFPNSLPVSSTLKMYKLMGSVAPINVGAVETTNSVSGTLTYTVPANVSLAASSTTYFALYQ